MQSERLHCEIDFEPIGRRTTIPCGLTVMDAARQAGVALSADCGGNGTCGRCRVRLMDGKLSMPTGAEVKRLGEVGLQDGWRLACQAVVENNVKIYVPLESMRGAQRLQLGGLQPDVAVEPIYEGYALELSPPNLQDTRSDVTRLLDALAEIKVGSHFHIDLDVARSVSSILRQDHWQTTVWIREGEICALYSSRHNPIGMAVDLGTTKIAVYLVDLMTGATLSSAGVMNPQIAYGEDLMSRIAYAQKGQAQAAELSRVVMDALNKLLGELCDIVGRSCKDILEMVVVGNTAMHHLFLRLPVEQLGRAPYVAALSDSWDIRANDLGLNIAPGGYVHLLPNVAGFVGADHIAMILGAEIHKAKDTVIGLDIGTNTEIVLAHDGQMTSCSCASGPAFEGAHIRDGMRAATGAIERVIWTGQEIRITVIDDVRPVGICGSGILDAVAAFYKAGIINKRGRFQLGHPCVVQGQSEPHVVLAPAESTGHGEPIVVTQHDVNEIQLAKGAIRTGIECLLRHRGLRHEDLDRVVIAGAFGTFVDVESAVTIGLLPALSEGRFSQVGNAAGVGAKTALISRSQRALAKDLRSRIEYLELMAQPHFMEIFAESMLFPDLPG